MVTAIYKRFHVWLVTGLVLAVVVGGVVWLKPYYDLATGPVPEDRCPGHEQFLPWEWSDSALVYSELAPRGCMVADLLRRTRLVGMTRQGILALLGQPTRTSYFKGADLVYWLGPEPGWFSIDSEWLVIGLDATGRVKEAKVLTD